VGENVTEQKRPCKPTHACTRFVLGKKRDWLGWIWYGDEIGGIMSSVGFMADLSLHGQKGPR